MQGKIINVIQDKGYGFIKGVDGLSYFFPFKNVSGTSSKLTNGDSVSFSPVKNPRGMVADSVRRLATLHIKLCGHSIDSRKIRSYGLETRLVTAGNKRKKAAHKSWVASIIHKVYAPLQSLFHVNKNLPETLDAVKFLVIKYKGNKPDTIISAKETNVDQAKIMISNFLGG